METIAAIGLVAILLVCPLMMIGMMVGGWIFGRRAMGHGGHGMMMCHGSHGDHSNHEPTVDELKAERDRLDRAIEAADRERAIR